MPVSQIMIVGLGTAGTTHCRVLESIPGAQVIAGIDTEPRKAVFRGSPIPAYKTLFEASALEPDTIIVATPTPTHARVCEEVTGQFPEAAVIVEKPAADSLDDALRILEGVAGKHRVHVAYHMAFSPEVEWGLKITAARRGGLGPPVAAESRFFDPYHADLASAQRRLGTSWIDSGINALSVIERFASLTRRIEYRQLGKADWSAYEGRFECETGGAPLTATVLTSWHATGPSRSTRIRYASGRELVLDHNAVTGCLLHDGSTADLFGTDGVIPRRDAHYRAFYKSLLAGDHPVFSPETSQRLHQLLLAPNT